MPAAKTTPSTERSFDQYMKKDDGCYNPGQPDMGKYGSSCTGQYLLNGGKTWTSFVGFDKSMAFTHS